MSGPSQNAFRRLVRELHRRSLWQVLGIYLAGSWLAYEVVEGLTDGLALPEWFPALAFVLLIIGLPVVLATAFVQEGPPRSGDFRPTPIEGLDEPGDPGANVPEEEPAGLRRIFTWRNAIAGGVLAFALWGVVATAWLLLPRGEGGATEVESGAPGAPSGEASVAVLPFVNMSPEGEHEYFSDGITEEILNTLARLPGLNVAARTSSFAFKGQQLPVDEIGRRLRVDHVLEGSVRRMEDRLRITAQLIDADNGYHVWSESYDRRLEDVFAVQEEIARAITDALLPRLVPQDQSSLVRPTTRDREAYDLYLRGRYLRERAGPEDLESAVAHFRRALELDGGYALAHAWLADTYTRQGNWGHRPPRQVFPLAMEEARKAVELNPELPEAHTFLAHLHRWWEHDREAAERHFRRALSLDPGNPVSHELYAWFLLDERKFDDAVRAMERAREIDPYSGVINHHLGLLNIYAGRHEEALRVARNYASLELGEEPGWVPRIEALVHLDLGRHEEAISAMRRALERGFVSPYSLGQLGDAYARSGRVDEARRVLSELEERGDEGYSTPVPAAEIHLGLGEKERALDRLEDALALGALLPEIDALPWFEELRGEPRFHRLLRELGLPER